MKYRNTRKPRMSRSLLTAALYGCLLSASPYLLAQSTGATIRGQVLVDSAPASDAQVTATNVATGLKRTVQASNSTYSLGGLPPGTYTIDVAANGQSSSQTVTVAVGQTATVNLGVGGVAESAPTGEATDLDTVTVVAPPAMVETKTSELATYVSQKQIEALPQGTRNFLAFADSVPGMVFSRDGNGNTKLRSGSQSASNTNVYVDGVGQKSYTLPGGVSGQDTSRGNPFPQSAIGEYKVITSNYKAEFDQISSAAIVAATKSGSNEFHGDFFYDKTTTQWREKTPAEEDSGEKVKSREEQYGLSLSGPIIQDKLQYFIAYEAKEYNTPKTTTLGSPSRYDISQVPAEYLAEVGSTDSPFKQDMYFGKLTWLLNDYNMLEFSAQVRQEDEVLRGGGQNLPSRATVNVNDVARYDLRYQYSGDVWLNDAHVTYEDTSWAPQPLTPGNGYILTVSDLTEPGIRRQTDTVLNAGAGPNNQEKGQKGWGVQDDLTFTGWEGHTLKMGVKFKSVEVNAVERHFSNPQFTYDIDLSTTQPYKVEFGTGDVGTSEGFTTSTNKQFGIYIQDDWEVNEHLLLNLGLRYDYETTPSYEDYETPQALVDTLRAWPNIHQPGVDYDIEDYISDGGNRKPDRNNWAPRLGFSYDLNADQRHVIFGGAGRAYDRNLFDYVQVEQNRASYGRYQFYFPDADGVCRNETGCVPWDPAYLEPGALATLAQTVDLPREWWLNHNELAVPYSDQYSIGMRNVFDMFGHEWNSEVAFVRINSYDGLVATQGNRRPDGSWFPPGGTWGAPWDFDSPAGQIVIVRNGYETKTNSVLLSLNKPYTKTSGWGTTLAYTYTDGKQNTNSNGWIDMFDYPDTSYYGWLPARGVAQHRFVGTGIVDGPWGLTFSAKLTLESPKPRTGTNCLAGWNDCIIDSYKPDGTIGFTQLDLAATKEIALSDDLKIRLRADVLNVTNERNWDGYDDWWGAPGEPNANFGTHNDSIVYPTRMVKLSFGVNW